MKKNSAARLLRLIGGIALLAIISSAISASAALVTLTNSDVLNTSSFSSGIGVTNWDSGQPPTAGNSYFVTNNKVLRSPVNGLAAGKYTFAGDSLIFGTSGQFLIKGSNVLVISSLIFSNNTSQGIINGNASSAPDTARIQANIQVVTSGMINASTNRFINFAGSTFSGSGGLNIVGSGTIYINGSHPSFTGPITITGHTVDMDGTTVMNPSALIVGKDTSFVNTNTSGGTNFWYAPPATNVVRAGGQLNVGSGTGGNLTIGWRTSNNDSNSVVAVLDVSSQNQFAANVGSFYVGYNPTSGAGTAAGLVYLATNNTITCTNVLIGDAGVNASSVTSQVVFGPGSNVINSPVMVVGARKQGSILTVGAGGTMLLTNSASGRMDLTVGGNNAGTSANPIDIMNLTGGKVIASLGNLVVAQKSGGLSGGAQATLTLATNAANNINVNNVTLGNMAGNASGTTAANGTLNLNGGSHTINTNLNMALWDLASGTATGTLNLNSATMTVAGNIANGGGTSTLTLNSSTLNVGGNIANTNTVGTSTLNINNSTVTVAGDVSNGTGTMTLNFNSGLLDMLPAGDATPGNIAVNSLVLNGALTNAASLSVSNLTGAGSSRSQTGTLTVAGALNPGTSSSAGTLTLGSLTLSSTATLRMNLTNNSTVGSGANDFLDITGDLDLGNATLQINQLASGLATGTYRLANVTGNINNSFGSYPTSIGRYSLSVQVDTGSSPKHLNLVVSGTPYSLLWGGELGSAWDTTTQNWTNQLNSPDYFNDSDNVRFDDISANPNVTVGITLQPGNIVFSNNINNYVLSGTGSISGGATLTKDGSGTLTISTSNDFSGAVSINAGRVQATAVGGNNGSNGGPGALGGSGGVVTIASGATLDVNDQHFTNKVIHVQGTGNDGNGPIVNTDTLNSQGDRQATRNVVLDGDTTFGGSVRWDIRGTGATNTGSFTGNHNLTVNNTGGCYFTDGINVNIGDILITSGSRIAIETYTAVNTNANITVNNGAWLYFYRLVSPMGRPVIMQDGASMGSTDAISTNQNQVSGPVTINGSCTFSASNNSTNVLHLSGPVSGPGVFVKSGAQTVELDNTNNNWTVGTLVSQGTLQIGNGTLDGNLPDYPITNNTTVNYAAVTPRTLTASIVNSGTWQMSGPSALTLSGPISGPGTWTMAGTGALTLDGQITGATAFNIRSNGNLTINGTIDTTAGVSKVGDGTVTLTASNSFPGNYTTGSGTPTSGGITRVLNSYAFGDPGILKTCSVIRAEVRLESTNNGINLSPNLYIFTSANSTATGVGGGYVALRNVSGTNSINGTIEVGGGAGDSELTADAGSLQINGTVYLGAVSSRNLLLSGIAGIGSITGAITNLDTNALSLVKNGTGTWKLAAANLYNGSTTVKGGTLLINGSIGGSTLTIQANATLGGIGTINTTNISFLAGSHAVFTLGSPLTFSTALALATSGTIPDVHLNLSNNVPVGSYTLATYNPTGSSGAFAASPVVDSGSFAAGTQGTISTSGGNVTLTVSLAAPSTPPNFSAGGVSVLPSGGISLVATGAINGTYKLWASTNLALTPFTNHATLLQSGTVTTSPFTNIDLMATNYPQRFYLFTTP